MHHRWIRLIKKQKQNLLKKLHECSASFVLTTSLWQLPNSSLRLLTSPLQLASACSGNQNPSTEPGRPNEITPLVDSQKMAVNKWCGFISLTLRQNGFEWRERERKISCKSSSSLETLSGKTCCCEYFLLLTQGGEQGLWVSWPRATRYCFSFTARSTSRGTCSLFTQPGNQFQNSWFCRVATEDESRSRLQTWYGISWTEILLVFCNN